MNQDPRELSRQAQAHQNAGRWDEAIALRRKILDLQPQSGVAEHNLAGILGDAGRWSEAAPHVERAFARGLDAPETWLLHARCQQSLGRLDEAEQGLREALRRRPFFMTALKELSQLRWMRTGDVGAALADIEAAIAQAPQDTRLQVEKARVLEQSGRPADGFALADALAKASPGDAFLACVASQLAIPAKRYAEALQHGERAYALNPGEVVIVVTLAEACLACGEAERAETLASEVRERLPANQHAIALLATAWRLKGDPRFRELYDYKAFVRQDRFDTPDGWPSLEAYLAELIPVVKAEHEFATHPYAQSVRHGSQAVNILHNPHPTTRALAQAIDGPIRRYMQAVGAGADPLRSRNTGRYRVQGLWSIRMRAGGFHIDHVHSAGWLSSACYLELPGAEGREGWIKFGQPGAPTTPALEAEHYVEPHAGDVVLFPSYMWHGTVPFTGDGVRMTIAFDVAPD